MKRLSLAMTSIAVAGLMTMVSCRKPNVENITGAPRTVTFTATTQSNDGSKTTLEGFDVKWSNGDMIYVNGTGTGNQLTLSKGATTTEGTFTSKNFTATAPYMVAYPMPSEISQSQITFNLPDIQDGNDATLGGRIPMAAYSTEEGKLSFKNAVNVLKLWLKGNSTSDDPASKLTSIVLSHASANLNGDIVVTIKDGEPTFDYATGMTAKKKTTVNFGEGLQLKSDVDNYVYIVLPMIPDGDKASEGIKIRFNCANDKYMETTFPYDEAFSEVSKLISHDKALTVNATTASAPAPTVTTNDVCDCNQYKGVSGMVTSSVTQECQYGFVYAKTTENDDPTIDGTGCKKSHYTGNVTAAGVTFNADLDLEVGEGYSFKAYAIGENGDVQYGTVKTITGGDTPVDVNRNGGETPGASPKEFTVGVTTDLWGSISSYKKVRFSQGNLQYIGSDASPYWKFADYQFEFIGGTKGSGQGTDSQTVDRDLFGWGTSGGDYSPRAIYYQPWSISEYNLSYNPYNSGEYNLYDRDGKAEWGYNKISNGGNTNGIWRTLKNDEWGYLFKNRTDASNKWGKGKVGNCTNGLIILPDEWDWEEIKNEGLRYPDGTDELKFTVGKSEWLNTYSYSDWSKMESHGAVFLPAAGFRNNTFICNVGTSGEYWSSSVYNDGYTVYKNEAHSLDFDSNSYNPQFHNGRSAGLSVRLVKDVPTSK